VERNFLAHSGGGNDTLDTPTFNKRWQDAEVVLLALGASVKEIAELKSMALDKTLVNLEENLSILHDNLLQHIGIIFYLFKLQSVSATLCIQHCFKMLFKISKLGAKIRNYNSGLFLGILI